MRPGRHRRHGRSGDELWRNANRETGASLSQALARALFNGSVTVPRVRGAGAPSVGLQQIQHPHPPGDPRVGQPLPRVRRRDDLPGRRLADDGGGQGAARA
eukprot:gene14651-biopygen6635